MFKTLDAFDQSTWETVLSDCCGKVKLIVTDPPYGGIVDEHWDVMTSDKLILLCTLASQVLVDGGSMYLWGGTGKPGNRPFYEFLSRVERETPFTLKDHITWSKRRAYGIQHGYLYTREECAWLTLGPKPSTFHIPLLDELRGYAGYNPKYPAKSPYLRRTNVWTDVPELFRGKTHPTQKPEKLYEIPILAHTEPGDWVIDPFAGSRTIERACEKTGRKSWCSDLYG